MKQIIRLTESDLHRIINQSVKFVLNEEYNGLIDNIGKQRLQRKAREKGFNYIAYHNTDNKNLIFFNVRTSGIHFGSENAAKERGKIRVGKTYTNKYFLKIVNPYVIEKDFDWEHMCIDIEFMDENEYEEWRKEYDPSYYLSQNGFNEMVLDNDGNVLYARTLEEMLSDKGYDCIIYKNQIEDMGSYSVCMFNPNNIKLAKTTYDDNGNPIPLDKRFDTSTDDVRY